MQAHSYFLRDPAGKSRMRSIHDPPSFLLAVDPRGKIRTLSYGLNGTSSKLRSQLVISGKRPIGRRDIALTDTARDAGWRHLEELYEAEIEDEGMSSDKAAARMRDYQQVVRWYESATARKGGKMPVELNPLYLPKAILGTYKAPSKDGDLELAPPSLAVDEKPAKAASK